MATSAKPREVQVIDVSDTVGDTRLIANNRNVLRDAALDWQNSDERGAPRIVLDFSRISYIDSSGLSTMVTINKKIALAGGRMIVAGLDKDLTMLMELTKLDTLFWLVETPERAKESIQKEYP